METKKILLKDKIDNGILRLTLNNSKNQKVIFDILRKANIGVNLHYIPVYKQPYYKAFGFPKDYCLEAEKFFQEAISLPIYPSLKLEEQKYIVEKLKEALF